MQALLFGSTGQLGQAIKQLLERHQVNLLSPTRQERDLADFSSTVEYVKFWSCHLEPGVVIYAAGLTDIDACASDPWASRVLNQIVPVMISQIATHHGHRFVYFSSDQVFGPYPGGYRHHEVDLSDERWPAVNDYGRHKAETEHLLKRNPLTTVVRVQWLYGNQPSWVDSIVTWSRQGRSVVALPDYLGVPTNVHHVAEALWEILQSPDPSGCWHLVAEGDPISRYDLAKFIFSELNLSGSLAAQVTPPGWLAPRSLRSLLKNHRGPKLPAWPEALAAYLQARHTGNRVLSS